METPELFTAFYFSPIGTIEIRATDTAIVSVMFSDSGPAGHPASVKKPEVLELCLQQLDDYFNGDRLTFDLPVAPEGTDFQKVVWQQLLRLPAGKPISYASLARQLQNPKAIRAVGKANSQNKVLLLYPCHRVIGTTGDLIGYAGGLWRKKWLLEHEAKIAGTAQLELFL